MRWLPRLAISVGLLVLLWAAVDGADALARLRQADLRWLVAAFVMLNIQTLLSALRWRLTAAQLGQRIGVMRAVSEYYLAQFVNQTLPGGVLGDAGRAVRARHEAGLARAGQAVVLERLAGQAALFAVMIVAVATTVAVGGGLSWPGSAGHVALAAVGAVLALALVAAVFGRIPGPPANLSRLAGHALLAHGVWPRQLALSAGTVACNLAAFAFCAEATGTNLSFAAATAVVPLILATMLLPVSIGGWGLREGATAALWPLVGATPAAGIAASVAFGLTLVAASLPGLAVAATGRGAAR
ncbi:lysylphosphatidylglycerol synthase transmembrane domain-containing protein [Roseitranquillus sediminis]|uniref:lysylphosphatidylglycerol synthase transmembrane domain-containing protein n=1 Tax=Roseitranquillus sediminis TaxID=2809051 RepID=UPI001D0CD51B|nr:lysylphosphatidylglycerol synthase transmembrane domain-containing protein [Roseitranquillus sediminis]